MEENCDMGNIVKVQHYVSPCGELLLGSYCGELCLCDWCGDDDRRKRVDRRILRACEATFVEAEDAVLTEATRQLAEYFEGTRTAFDMPLLLVGTELQKRVWCEIAKIPYGVTLSYGELTKRIGATSSVRAVANACGANAMSIILPCHRVVGASGKLTGYAGGLSAKSWLLSHEQGERKLDLRI